MFQDSRFCGLLPSMGRFLRIAARGRDGFIQEPFGITGLTEKATGILTGIL